MKKRALISVFDKSGVIEFARELIGLGFEIVSTGGTEKALKEAGVPVINVSDVTGFPECLDGRVKTLHPAISAGVLAMRSNPEHMAQIEQLDIAPIDVVAINLYPFKQTMQKPGVTLEECIENIDIGGPTLLRASAKNWQDVAVIVEPDDYGRVVSEMKLRGEVSRELKFELAARVFEHTAHYDAMIAEYLRRIAGAKLPKLLTPTYELAQTMRYGENPHQAAAFYREVMDTESTIAGAQQLHGKELSFNNIADANAAIAILKEFEGICAVAVKHMNPCGVALGDTVYEAYTRAYESDPVSIFGGIVALNAEVDEQTAHELAKIFLEIIIAPSFSPAALDVLTQKKNIRLLKLPKAAQPLSEGMWDMRKVAGGMLLQGCDTGTPEAVELKVVTKTSPTPEQLRDLKFAMKIVKHVKSNGIALTKDCATVGVGPGQTNRITALNIAIDYAGDKAKGAVMASDAFFPFADCVEAAAKAGIAAIIQPGGSVRDEESIKACDQHGIAMVFTGMRHFKH